jgi:hyperosmotically inducible periplasmic protein
MKLKTLAALMIATGLALPLASHAAGDGNIDRSSMRVWVKDSVITTKIKAQLAANQPASMAKLHVETDAQGYVRLTGRVNTPADGDRAVAIAKTVDGVTWVDNQIKVTGDN